MDRLSYRQYGNVLLLSLFIMATLFNLIPEFIVLTVVYLFSRGVFEEPIHANGLNKCYVCTMTFYLLVFILITFVKPMIGSEITFVLVAIIGLIATFSTSTMPNKVEQYNKLFWGRKKENGKYADLFRFIKFDPTNKKLCEYEDRLKDSDMFTYYVFKYIFRDGLTWDETMDKLDIYERKELDKEIYAIYRTLQYVLDLKRLD